MNIIIVDNEVDRTKKIAESFSEINQQEVYYFSLNKLYKKRQFGDSINWLEPEEGIEDIRTEILIAVVHDNDSSSWETLCEQLKELSKSTFVVRYSGQYQDKLRKSNQEWISRSVTINEPLTSQEARGILNYFQCQKRCKEKCQIPAILDPSKQKSKFILSALAILCQGYLAVHPETELYQQLNNLLGDVSQKTKTTENPEWWQQSFASEDKTTLTEKITGEWEPEALPQTVSKLLDAIEGNESITDVKMVEAAYKAIAARLTSI